MEMLTALLSNRFIIHLTIQYNVKGLQKSTGKSNVGFYIQMLKICSLFTAILLCYRMLIFQLRIKVKARTM